ncbi:MAG: hypothetical protein B6I20_07460 [Bacteroidetes bacterium 4572_117]|nr:MAG: hypothetical protein B6I20_07460 [Bacteroidetes bacterium 4572_117]
MFLDNVGIIDFHGSGLGILCFNIFFIISGGIYAALNYILCILASAKTILKFRPKPKNYFVFHGINATANYHLKLLKPEQFSLMHNPHRIEPKLLCG